MTNAMTITPSVTHQYGRAMTTSQAVAILFGKRHDNVLRAYSSMECSPEFTALNFEASDYTDTTGRKLPIMNMTKDGFVFLAMGFTGKAGAQFKEAYINRFNELEARAVSVMPALPDFFQPGLGCTCLGRME